MLTKVRVEVEVEVQKVGLRLLLSYAGKGSDSTSEKNHSIIPGLESVKLYRGLKREEGLESGGRIGRYCEVLSVIYRIMP